MESTKPASDSPPSTAPSRRHSRIDIYILAVVLLCLSYYVGSYYRLSRRGMAEADMYGSGGFLYVPWAEVMQTEDLSRHHTLRKIYAPLNWIDRQFLRRSKPDHRYHVPSFVQPP